MIPMGILASAVRAAGGATAGEPYFDKVVALLHLNGSDGATSFPDETGTTWTVNGAAQVDTAQSKFGGASLLLDGNTDYLISPVDADYGFGYEDFTVEFFFRPRVNQGNDRFLVDLRGAAGDSFVIWASQSSHLNKLCYSNQAGAIITSSSITWTAGAWHHVAITRSAGILRGFIDGVIRLSTTEARNLASPQGIYLGSSTTANQGCDGHIDEFRVTKGFARYTSAFTPPAAPFPETYDPLDMTDPDASSVSALLHFDGADASTTITDETGLTTWTPTGSAQIDTAQSKFGGSSLLLNGTTAYVTAAAAAGLGFGSGDYTVEMWVRLPNTSSSYCAFDNRFASAVGISIYPVIIGGGLTGQWGIANNSAVVASGTTLSANIWTHLVVVRQGTTVRGYRNGVQEFTVTDSRTYASSVQARVGASIVPGQYMPGHIEEFRITKGVCRYPNGDRFDVPVLPFEV